MKNPEGNGASYENPFVTRIIEDHMNLENNPTLSGVPERLGNDFWEKAAKRIR